MTSDEQLVGALVALGGVATAGQVARALGVSRDYCRSALLYAANRGLVAVSRKAGGATYYAAR